jgi:ABC-2 type transport system permease protein
MVVIVFIGMPLILMPIMKPAFQSTLVQNGHPRANGAEQAVPGMAVLFGSFLVAYVGFVFFREHGWATWERLRATPAHAVEIIIGKGAPPLLLGVVQLVVLFALGRVLFGLQIRGSLLGLVIVGVALSICLVTLGLALVSVTQTIQQLNALAYLGAMVFAGVGGALVPLSALPGWARSLGPGTPTYWAMRAFRSILLDGEGLGGALLPAGVLLAFSFAFVLVAAARFSTEEAKVFWA